MNFKTIILAIVKTFSSILEAINAMSFAWSVGAALFFEFVQRFVFKDWSYLVFLTIPFAMDWFFGSWWAIKNGTFSFERVYDVIAKVFVYSGVLVLGHVLSYFTVGEVRVGNGIVANTFYSLLLAYESHSALKNMGLVYPRAAFIQWAEQKLGEIIKSKQTVKLDIPDGTQSQS